MKRLIIILALFSAVVGVAVFEMVYLNRFYGEFISRLETVHVQFMIDEENIDHSGAIEAVEKAREHWEKNRRTVLMFSNNNVVRLINERMTSLTEQTRINHPEDAFVTLMVTINYLEELRRENGVSIEGLV
ncbi:MAG: DUF4363 family protein [Firmicutes bacterium]|nr:DUF4363 family protein [Bacillota bacterium]MCL2255490.1 DUF4363 family protein [Bacillota bacterium]